jgi:hypothetical protein
MKPRKEFWYMKWISSARVSRSSGGLRVVAALAFLAAAGCHSLEVANPNDPDVTRALASGGDVQSLLGGGFRNWYHSMADVDPNIAWDITADHEEMAWGNWAARYTGWEPRIYPYVNTHTDPNTWTPVGEELWYNNYAAVVSANLVLKALAATPPVRIPGPIDSSSNQMIRTAATFLQGVAMSQIALTYDSGYALDENTDVTKIKLVGRDSVQKVALAKLDKAITMATGATWTSIPERFLNQTGEAWTPAQLVKVANTFAARAVAYYAHNVTENAAANWSKVVTYASAGISSGAPFDMEIIGDGPMDANGATPNEWVNDHLGMAESFQIWMRTDYRVICLFDPTYQCHKTNNGIFPRMPVTSDARFTGGGAPGNNCIDPSIITISNVTAGEYCSLPGGTGNADFIYDSLLADWPGYSPARGYYRFSPVGHVRYWNIGYDSPDNYVGRVPFILAAENDLLWAEALVRTGGAFATAAAKINTTRVGRGKLPALTGAETAAQLLNAIIYEKAIELYGTGDRVAYYDARRWSANLNPHYYTAANDADQTGWGPYGTGLQPGSIRLFPVPAQELTLLGDKIYTFGGVSCTAPNTCTPVNPEPPAPPAHGAVVARGGSIFGVSPDGRVITGPGKYNAIADSIFAANRRARRRPM